MPASPRRLAAAASWLAPSLVAACVGGAVMGLAEGLGELDPGGSLAAAGFVALIAIPVIALLLMVGRIVIVAWRPRELALALVERDDSMPRLAGWMVTIALGLAALAAIVREATWVLARHTPFRAPTVGLLYPLVVAGATLVLAALSGPVARVAAAAARSADARWRARGHRTLLTPRMLATTAGVIVIAGATVAWNRVVRPAIGPLDLSPLDAPFAGLVATTLAATAWPRLARFRRSRLAGGAMAILVAGALIAVALVTPDARPSMTLEIWGVKPLAGLAIERLYDLETIRAHVSLAEYQPVARPGAAHPDIILVTIDTVRADHTPPYGGTADMPVLAGLGVRGTVFEWGFSPSNVTRRSIPSLITGLSADRVHGRVVGWALRLDPRHVVLAERLQAGGYDTAGFMCCDGFWGERAKTGLQRGLAHVEIDHDGLALSKLASTWLAAREATHPTRPLFVWMHILEPHNWTTLAAEPSDPGDRSRLYDRSLASCDPMLAALLSPFAGRSPDRAPIIIVTADHGEALGDHGSAYHSTDLYNSQTRVPLVIAGPGIPRQRVTETVSLTGLTPTIVELAGFTAADHHMDGIAFTALATGQRGSRPDGVAFAAMIKDRSNPGNVTAYVRGHWKLLVINGREELYDIAIDPDERVDVAARNPQVLVEVRAALAARNAAARASPFE